MLPGNWPGGQPAVDLRAVQVLTSGTRSGHSPISARSGQLKIKPILGSPLPGLVPKYPAICPRISQYSDCPSPRQSAALSCKLSHETGGFVGQAVPEISRLQPLTFCGLAVIGAGRETMRRSIHRRRRRRLPCVRLRKCQIPKASARFWQNGSQKV